MCEPVSASIAIGAMALGTGAQIYGDWKQATDAAETAEENARRAREAASEAMALGAYQAGRARMEGTRVIGALKAAQAATGEDISSGSAAKLAAANRVMSELDAEMLKNNAFREALGYKRQADDIEQQAEDIRASRFLRATGTFLGGVGNIVGSDSAKVIF